MLLEIVKSEEKRSSFAHCQARRVQNLQETTEVELIWTHDIRRIRPWQRKSALLPVFADYPNFREAIFFPGDHFSRKLVSSLLSSDSHDTPTAVCMQSARRRIINLTNLGHRYIYVVGDEGPHESNLISTQQAATRLKGLIYNHSFCNLLNRNLGAQSLFVNSVDKSC